MRTSFQKFTDGAVIATDKDLRRRISEVQNDYRELYSDVADRVRELYRAYRESGSRDGIYRWSMDTGEYAEMIDDIAILYTNRSEEIEEKIYIILVTLIMTMYYKMQYAYSWLDELPDMMQLPPTLIDLAVEGSNNQWSSYRNDPDTDGFGGPEMWKPKRGELSAIMRAHRDEELQNVTSHLAGSLSMGMGLRTTLKTIRRDISMVTRKKKADGTTVTSIHGAAAGATRVLRTEGNRLINAAVVASAVGAYGLGTLSVKKEWVAILDTKTREQSYTMDGQLVGLDEPFIYPNGATSMYPGQSGYAMYDVNCRCSCMTVLATDEGQTVGIDPLTGEEGVFSWDDYDEWVTQNGFIPD